MIDSSAASTIEHEAARQEARDTVESYRLDLTRLVYMQSIELSNNITHADNKANLILGVDTLLFAAVTTTTLNRADGAGFPVEAVVLALTLVSIWFALLTVLPRRSRKEGGPGSEHFYGDIVNMSQQAFLARWMDMSMQDVKVSVLKDIYGKAHLADKKYAYVRRSMLFLMFSLIAWALIWLAQLVLGLA